MTLPSQHRFQNFRGYLRRQSTSLMSLLSLAIVISFSLAETVPAATSSEWKTNTEARVRLIVPFGLEENGADIWIGLQMQLEPHWHSYWKNPGAAGLPPVFTVVDSNLIETAEVFFPPPKFYPFGGGLDANGYSDEVIYPVKVTLTERGAALAAQPDFQLENFPLNLDLFYLVCKDLCIPHDNEFRLKVDLTRPSSSASAASSGVLAGKLSAALAKLPLDPADVPGVELTQSLAVSDDSYSLVIRLEISTPDENFPEIFFHQTPALNLQTPVFAVGDSPNVLLITTFLQTKVAGQILDTVTIGYLLTGMTDTEGLELSVETSALLTVTDDGGLVSGVGDSGPVGSILEILFFAFLGGLILNIMPCVLPVLSLKLMSVLGQSGETRSRVAGGMLASSGGIIFSFLLLATAAVIAKSAGAAVGWGVQFQEPGFVAFLALVVFLFGLNLWGVFEVVLPSSVSTQAGKTASSGGHFTQGMLATLLATPCSAPFLGPAVGFALSSPAWVIYSVFAALGVGMSAPYLIVAAFPGAVRLLPKPGAWMETAKVFFGFLLMATVIWLMYVLSSLVDPLSLALVWLALLLVALIVWLKRATAPLATFFKSPVGLLTVGALLVVSSYTVYFAGSARVEGGTGRGATLATDKIAWEPYSQQAVNEGLAAGKVVFVDVTADWCWTCKINEKLFIETEETSKRFRENGILALKADWTNRNAEIGEFLRSYGRSGIPFYIAFYGADQKNYLTLPVTITGGMLAEMLDEAVAGNRGFVESHTDNPDGAEPSAPGFILE